MSILKSTHSGKVIYWKQVLEKRGYYTNEKYEYWMIYPTDCNPNRIPEKVIYFDRNGEPSVSINSGIHVRRIPIVDIFHLNLEEQYWKYKDEWLNPSSYENTKRIAKEIIRYYEYS